MISGSMPLISPDSSCHKKMLESLTIESSLIFLLFYNDTVPSLLLKKINFRQNKPKPCITDLCLCTNLIPVPHFHVVSHQTVSASYLAEQTVWEIQQMNPILIGTAVSEYVIREMIKPAEQCTIGQSAVMDISFIHILDNVINMLFVNN